MNWSLEKVLLGFIKLGLILVLFSPLVVSSSTLFPFVFGKMIFIRVVVEIVLGFYIILALFFPKWRPKKSLLFYSLLGYLLILSLSTLFSVSPYRSFWSTIERMDGLFNLVHWLAFFVVLVSCLRTWPQWLQFLNLNFLASVLVALYAFFQQLEVGLPFLYLQGQGRVAGPLGNPAYLGGFLIIPIFLGLFLVFFQKKTFWKTLFLLGVFFEIYILIATATRGAIIGMAAGFLVWGVLYLIFGNKKQLKLAVAGGILFFVVVGSLLMIFRQSSFVETLSSKSQALERMLTILEDPSTKSRVLAWQIGLKAVAQKPLLGWGPENFGPGFSQYLTPDAYQILGKLWFDRPHNKLIEEAATGGILGLLGYLSIFGIAFWELGRLIKQAKSDKKGQAPKVPATCSLQSPAWFLPLVACLSGYFIQNLFLFDTPSSYLEFFLVLGLITFLSLEIQPHPLRIPSTK